MNMHTSSVHMRVEITLMIKPSSSMFHSVIIKHFEERYLLSAVSTVTGWRVCVCVCVCVCVSI